MSIQSLSRDQFEAFRPFRSPAAAVVSEETEWFADDAENILGVLLRDKIDDDWGYVILGRDEHFQFRAIDLEVSVETREEARNRLLAAMTEIERSGQSVFPQSDAITKKPDGVKPFIGTLTKQSTRPGHVIVRMEYVPWEAVVPGRVIVIRKEPSTMDEAKAEGEQSRTIPSDLENLAFPTQILPADFPKDLLARFSLVAFLSQTQSLCDIRYQDGTVAQRVRVHSLLFNAMVERRPGETIGDLLRELKIVHATGEVSRLRFDEIAEISPFYYTPATTLVLALVV